MRENIFLSHLFFILYCLISSGAVNQNQLQLFTNKLKPLIFTFQISDRQSSDQSISSKPAHRHRMWNIDSSRGRRITVLSYFHWCCKLEPVIQLFTNKLKPLTFMFEIFNRQSSDQSISNVIPQRLCFDIECGILIPPCQHFDNFNMTTIVA